MGLQRPTRQELLEELRRQRAQNRALRTAQASLEASRQRYADLYDGAPLPYFTFDPQGIILDLNQAAAALLGAARAQLVGRPFAEVAAIDPADAFAAHLARCAAGETCPPAELTLHPPGREAVVLQVDSLPLRDVTGRAYAVRTILGDVTAYKRLTRELERVGDIERELRARIEAIAQAQTAITEEVPTGSRETVLRTIVEHARRFTSAEFAAVGITGADGGDTWIYAGRDADEARAPYRLTGARAHRAPGAFVDLPVRYRGKAVGRLYLADKRDGSYFSHDDEQLLELLAARVGPALELMRLREAETRERERLDLLAEIGRALATTLDLDGVLARVMEVAVPRLADICVAYLVDAGKLRPVACRHVDRACEPELAALQADPRFGLDNPRGALARALSSGEPVFEPDYEPTRDPGMPDDPELRRRVARFRPRSLMVLPCSAKGRVFGLAALAFGPSGRQYELSDLALANAVFERAAVAIDNARLYRREQEAVRARDDLLAVVAHDLRNPLTSIYTGAQLLAQQAVEADVKKRAATMLQAAKRMRRLVDDLLDAAALEAGAVTLDVRTHAAAELIDEAITYIDAQARASGIEIVRELPAAPLGVRCDRERALQVLGNLLANAVKFAGAGGAIRVGARPSGARVRFAVSDTGPGIPEAERPHLFDRFWKGQQQGTGLGLYIAKRIVEAHGSRIVLEETSGRGSTFAFLLPAG